jgi:hypothetical protein
MPKRTRIESENAKQFRFLYRGCFGCFELRSGTVFCRFNPVFLLFGAGLTFLAQLLSRLGRIAEIFVVDINVLGDDRFDPPADSVGRFTLFDPNRFSSWKMWLGFISAIVSWPIVG